MGHTEEKESPAHMKGKDIHYLHPTYCEFKCSICGAWAGCVEGGTLDGGNFKYCPNCGIEIEQE